MRRWYHLGIAVVVLLSGCTAERDRLAPIVLPTVNVSLCALSPSQRYVITHTADPHEAPYQGSYDVQIFDLTTTQVITIPLDPKDLAVPLSLRWYRDDIVFVDQRWLYDIPHGIVTDTTTLAYLLPPTTYNFDVPQWNPSPDERYVANGSQIWERDPMTGGPGAVVIDLPSGYYTTGCLNAWSADSRSYYFVDWETVGPRQSAPGPIRKITLP